MNQGTEREYWARWIKASVAKHFDDKRQGVRLLVEGEHREIDEDHVGDIFELRMDGPNIKQFGVKYQFYLDAEINLLVGSSVRENDAYHFDKLRGIGVAIFTTCIPVYRYGNNKDIDDVAYDPVIDTGTLLGNLMIKHDSAGRNWIEDHPFGQIRPDVAIQQATIEGHYRMELNTKEVDNA